MDLLQRLDLQGVIEFVRFRNHVLIKSEYGWNAAAVDIEVRPRRRVGPLIHPLSLVSNAQTFEPAVRFTADCSLYQLVRSPLFSGFPCLLLLRCPW